MRENVVTYMPWLLSVMLKASPLGTKAPAIMGGWWFKMQNGWKWNGPNGNGGTFPNPGGDWNGKLIYPDQAND